MRNTVHHTNLKEPIPISVSVRDNYGNVVASGNYTTAGTYNLSFTPASAGANYTLEFHMTKASAFCFFRVDDVLVSFDDTTTVTVCKEVEDGYRYGFQNQERDDEIKGKGNSYNYTYRMHDTRLGRFFAVDPLSAKYPHYTPYSFSGNKVIHAVELEGAEELVVSNLKLNNQPIVYVNNDSQLQNYIMFVFASSINGVATTITRPVTAAEQKIYGNFLNRNGSNTSRAQVKKPSSEEDANGQFIRRTGSRNTNGANTPMVNTSPANTTTTKITNDFGGTPAAGGAVNAVQTINFQIANGSTNLKIDFSDGGNHPNNFVFTDGSTGEVLSPKGGYNGIATGVVLNIPSGVKNITLRVTGAPNQTFDTWSVKVTSSGPNASAMSVSSVSENANQSTNGLSMTTSPISVKSGVTSTASNPINQ